MAIKKFTNHDNEFEKIESEKKKIINEYIEKKYENEKYILNKMNKCKYSVKYIGSFEEKKKNKFIITELCNSNLRKELRNKENGFTIDEIKKIFCQINEGLRFLFYEINFIHRDLKPDNILINKITKKDKSYCVYKLCD